MNKRNLGKTGLKVPEMGMGCWAIGGVGYGPVSEADALSAIEAAWGGGMRFFDTADTYGEGRSEKLVGQFLNLKPRNEAVIATKVGWDFYHGGHKKNFDPSYIRFACDESLKRLSIEAIDFLQLHNPNLEILKKGEAFQAVLELKRKGKIRFAGLSLHTTEEALWALENLSELDSLQVIYNILDQRMRSQVFPLAKKKGVALIVREPLASGMLSGKYTPEHVFTKDDHRRRYSKEKLKADCEKMKLIGDLLHGAPISLARAALEFVLGEPEVSVVIPGAKNAEQVLWNREATQKLVLNPDTLSDLKHLFEIEPLFREHLLPAG